MIHVVRAPGRRRWLPLAIGAGVCVSVAADVCAALVRNPQSRMATALVDGVRLSFVELLLLAGGVAAARLVYRSGGSLGPRLLLAGLACAALAALAVCADYLFLRLAFAVVDPQSIGWTAPIRPPGRHSVPALYYSMDRAMAGMAAWVAYHTYRQARARLRTVREQERESAAAEMALRRRELQSDHLSRCLDAIAREADTDPAAADRMLVRLSDDLRAVVHDRDGVLYAGREDSGGTRRGPGVAG